MQWELCTSVTEETPAEQTVRWQISSLWTSSHLSWILFANVRSSCYFHWCKIRGIWAFLSSTGKACGCKANLAVKCPDISFSGAIPSKQSAHLEQIAAHGLCGKPDRLCRFSCHQALQGQCFTVKMNVSFYSIHMNFEINCSSIWASFHWS